MKSTLLFITEVFLNYLMSLCVLTLGRQSLVIVKSAQCLEVIYAMGQTHHKTGPISRVRNLTIKLNSKKMLHQFQTTMV